MLTAIFDQLGRDLGYALRQVRRNPGFSAVAITTLALGIGVNTAMFSAVDAVLIRPLPYADADRLVMVWDDNSRVGDSAHFFSTPAEWFEWRRHNTVFTDIAGTQPGDAAFSGNGEPEEMPARKVTGNFWSVLGARPQLGRTFTEDEDTRGDRVVVISHGLWQRRFGGSPDVVGRMITTLFYGFQPDFVGAVAVAAAVLLTVAALACLVPARRASRINPTVVLQHE